MKKGSKHSKKVRKNLSNAVKKRWQSGENLLEKAHIAFQKKCKQKRILLQCEVCGSINEYPPCRKDRKFCSSKCYGLSKKGKPWHSHMNQFLPHGKKHYNWKGGIKTRWPTREAIKWRNEIFKRDDYICQECKKRGCYLEAHHIKKQSEFLDLKYEITNGITLCKKCHLKTYGKEKYFEKKYIKIVNRK